MKKTVKDRYIFQFKMNLHRCCMIFFFFYEIITIQIGNSFYRILVHLYFSLYVKTIKILDIYWSIYMISDILIR